MGKTSIAWTDYSWNPIRAKNKATGKVGWHCSHVTRACENCYAETFNVRLGTGLKFKPGNKSKIDVFLDANMMSQPRRWHKRQSLKIFVCSMTDLFADFVRDNWLDAIFEEMEACPCHTFQILTKRPSRMRQYVNARYPGRPLRNLWCGVSIAEQRDLETFGAHLRLTNAQVRWLSVEPLIDNVRLTPDHSWVQWVVVGGESGASARPLPTQTAIGLRISCQTMRTAFFMKQLSQADTRDYENFDLFPEALRVREFPA
jgi:protein gp37